MKGVNYVPNEKGKKTALLIDFAELKKSKKEINELLEEIDDLIAAAWSNGANWAPVQRCSQGKFGQNTIC